MKTFSTTKWVQIVVIEPEEDTNKYLRENPGRVPLTLQFRELVESLKGRAIDYGGKIDALVPQHHAHRLRLWLGEHGFRLGNDLAGDSY